MLDPFINLFSTIISLYTLVLFIWVIMSLLINFDIINRHQPLVARIYYALSRLIEPALRPIRRVLGRILPDLGGIDLSPIVLILLLQFIQNAMFSWFWGL